MNFQEFWDHIANLSPNNTRCQSQGRGSEVDFHMKDQLIVCKSRARSAAAKPHKITKETAESYFNKLANGTPRFGKNGFRYKHSAWFHDVYAAVTGDNRR
jgi:hypothetical protein